MLFSTFFALAHVLGVAVNNMVGTVNQFKEYTTLDLLKKAGYDPETHTTTTKDGYILTLHRISKSKSGKPATKGPVLLQHGLLCSSADWIVTGAKSLGLTLTEAGYDVWLGNNRGTTYSHAHVTLDPLFDSKAFFNYSWHEMGLYDLPAMIDLVLETTHKDKIPYVGFSEGTTQFFVMMDKHPEYNNKISIYNAWAPVTNMYGIKNFFIRILVKFPIIHSILEYGLRMYEFLPHAKVGNIFRALCRVPNWLCNQLFHLLGQSWERMPSKAMKERILYNFPAGTSLKSLNHYVQNSRSGVFRPYDYGTKENKEIYGLDEPKAYDISATLVPTVLYYGDSDDYVNNEVLINDVARHLKNVTKLKVPGKNFNHLDFIWSNDVDWLNNATLANIQKYTE